MSAPDPVDVLMAEHRLILQALEALDGFADRVAHGEDADPDDLLAFVTFAREYVDARHHGKEEDLLFPAMAEEGLPIRDLPELVDEHERGRAATAELARLAEGPLTGDARAELQRAVEAYTSRLRSHILREDGGVFVVAATRLPERVREVLAEQFVDFDEARDDGPAEELAHRLVERYTSCGDCQCGGHATFS